MHSFSPHLRGEPPGRLRAAPGRQHSRCPAHSPRGCRDPAGKDSAGHPCLHSHLHSPAAGPGRRGPPCSVLPVVQQASPALEHVFCPTPENAGEPSGQVLSAVTCARSRRHFQDLLCIALLAETYPVKGRDDSCPGQLAPVFPPQTDCNTLLLSPCLPLVLLAVQRCGLSAEQCGDRRKLLGRKHGSLLQPPGKESCFLGPKLAASPFLPCNFM